MGGQETDDLLKEALKGDGSQPPVDLPELSADMAKFFDLLHNDWEPMMRLFHNSREVFDRPLVVSVLRALRRGAAEDLSHYGHREALELRGFVTALAEHSQSFIEDMEPSELALLSTTLARFGAESRPACTTLQRHAARPEVLRSLSAVELSDLLFGMARTGHRPPTSWLLQLTGRALEVSDG
ncbi:hypothetical protein MNEG_15880, partial [Monoraphidium neglectum]